MMKNFGLVYIFCLSILFISPLCIAFEISGSVSSSQSLQDVSILATNKANGMVYNTTSYEGKYSLQVPAGKFSLSASSSDSFSDSGWIFPSFFSIEMEIEITKDENIPFEFEPCFTLAAEAFDSYGNYLNFTDFSSFAWTTDLNQVAARSTVVELFSEDGSRSTLGFSIPLEEKRIIMAQFFLINVGNFVMKASNGSYGFSGSLDKRSEVINLNFEFAKDSFNSLREKLASELYKSFDDNSSQDLVDLMQSAVDSTSSSSKASIANQIIEKSIAQEEDLEMKRAARDIQLYRTSQVNVQVSDDKGAPLEGVTVRIEQQDHDFRFGLYGGQIPDGQEKLWKLMASAGINSATVDFWWIDTEPTAENVNSAYVLGQKIEFLKNLGLKLRATGLFQPDPQVIPSYALEMSYEDFCKSLYKHTFNLVSTYCQDFELVEVSTDLNTLAVKMGYNSSQILQLQQIALDAIKKAAPKVKTSVSMLNDYFAQSKYESFKGPSSTWDKTTLSPLDFSKLWIEAGQSIDQIGQQMYNGGNRAAPGSPNQVYDPAFSLATLSSHLDKLSSFGKPIRISEVAVPGTWGGNWDPSEAGFLGTEWDENSQANFITKFYTMAFSKKANKEISWWGLFDQAFAYPGGTFLDSEGKPKKAYQNLISLIRSWTTDAKVSSDSEGKGMMNAFGGSYKVSAFKNGNMIGMAEMKFAEGNTSPLSVKVTSKGQAVFSQSSFDFNGVVNPVVPAPINPTSDSSLIGDSNSSAKKMPMWAVPVVVVGGVVLLVSFSLLIVFIVVRRRIASNERNAEGCETPSKENRDQGLAAQDSVKYDSDLEAGSDLERRESIDAVPATWMGQPLSTVPLDSGSEGEEEESGRETETDGEKEEVLSGGEHFHTAAEYFPKESSDEERNSEAEEEEEEEEEEEAAEEESECDEALNDRKEDAEESSSEEEKL